MSVFWPKSLTEKKIFFSINMPLAELYPGAKATAVMVTCGPWSEDHIDQQKQQVDDFIKEYFQGSVKQYLTAFEKSKDGYKHIHIALEFVDRIKPYSFGIFLRKKMLEHFARDPEETRQFNTKIHIVPKCEKDKNGYSNYQHILCKYLTDPTKNKEVDDAAKNTINTECMTYQWKYCIDWIYKGKRDALDEWNKMKKDTEPIWKLMCRDYKAYKRLTKDRPTRAKIFHEKFGDQIKWKSKTNAPMTP
jgi:hypothetical protein